MLTVAEVAQHLHVSSQCVYSLISDGRLTVHRIGTGRGTIRVAQGDLDAFLESCRCETINTKQNRRPSQAGLKHLKLS